MRDMPSSDLVSLISFLVALLIFFSIDMKARQRRGDDVSLRKARAFARTSHVGGIATSIALALAWFDLFLPDDNKVIHVLLVAVPGSIGVACTIILSVELLFDRSDAESP